MNASRATVILGVWLLAMLVLVASVLAMYASAPGSFGAFELAWALTISVGFTTVGALIAVRRPGEPIGRVCLLVGILICGSIGLRAVAVVAYAQRGPMPDAAALAAVVANSLNSIALIVSGGFLLSRFPSGRERSGLALIVDVATLLAVAALVVTAFVPGTRQFDTVVVSNPVGIDALGRQVTDALSSVSMLGYAVGLAVAVVIVVRRYRRSGPTIRAQIRWVAAAGVVPVVLLATMTLTKFDPLWALWIGSTALMPFAIGVAILRYHLYDIDRIIGRTLAYAFVTALLAGVFVVTNIALQTIVSNATESNTLVVAVSTLVVAALFQPVRRPVQRVVDRRFNRAHADAAAVVAGFTRRTRDEVDLERLGGVIVSTVQEAVAPAQTGVWLRVDR